MTLLANTFRSSIGFISKIKDSKIVTYLVSVIAVQYRIFLKVLVFHTNLSNNINM